MAFDRRPTLPAKLSFALLLALGCDGKNGVIYDDGGTDAPTVDAGRDTGTDADDGDREAPSVTETTPSNEATAVALDADVTVRFSEPMTGSGTLLVVPGSISSSIGTWNALGDTVTFAAPPVGWPESADIRASLEGFTDVAGNALPAFTWRFSTTDEAPFVTTSTPLEGAMDVSARASSIELSFSEPMDNTVGEVSATGLTFGDAEWLSGNRVRFSVEGLVYDTSYSVTLEGFLDRAGNALDTSTYLEGTLDFATGPDTDAPRVIDSNPDEGQFDVATDLLDEVLVVFDEPMDTAVGTATLEVDARSTPLTATWNAAATEVRFSVGGALLNGANHRVVLAGFTDAAGNALDEATYLLDGALDFRTGRDLVVPFVGFSDPIEGQDDFSFRRDTILVSFSEAMETTTTTVTLHDGAETTTLDGTWSVAGTRLTLDVTNLLLAGRTYRIDLTGFRDLGGTVVDAAHPYLADGFLDFTMATPTGENCRDVLTEAEGTTVGGVTTWVIEDRQATLADGSGTCGPAGDTRSADTVIRVTKTSAAVADGGRYLRIAARNRGVSRLVFIEVYRGVCDPTSPEALPAREQCLLENQSWDVHLDGPPGDYFVWIATNRNDAISPVDVIVEEIDAPRQGETCDAPFDRTVSFWDDENTGLSDRPLGPAWYIDIRNNVDEGDDERIDALDRADVYGGVGSIECGGTRFEHGSDAVFDLPKTSATSVLDVRMTAIGSQVFEIRDACDPSTSTQLACGEFSSGRWTQRTFEGPPGTYALWLAPDVSDRNDRELDGSIVVREIEPAAGESCATGIPLVAGVSQTIAPSPRRLAEPNCFDGQLTEEKPLLSGVSGPDDGITWYRFTASGAVSAVRFGSNTGSSSDLDPSVALIDATTRTELSCSAESPQAGLTVFGNAGREYCVAVLNTPRLTSIELETFAVYDGVGNSATDLGVLRPFNDSGNEVTITTEYWMAATPTTLYMQVGSSGTSAGLLRVGKTGGTRAELLRDGIESVLGFGGLAIDETVFLADNLTTAAPARVHRVVRDGLVEITAWDPSAGYPSRAFYALTHDGSRLLTATYHSVTGATLPESVIYELSPTTPGAGTPISPAIRSLEKVRSLVSHGGFLYLVADIPGPNTTTDPDRPGVYRLPWSDLAATPEVVWQGDMPSQGTLHVQTTGTTTYLYFRDGDGNVHVADIGGTSPTHIGVLSSIGRSGDIAFTFDPAGPAIYLFETESDTTGRIVRIQ